MSTPPLIISPENNQKQLNTLKLAIQRYNTNAHIWITWLTSFVKKEKNKLFIVTIYHSTYNWRNICKKTCKRCKLHTRNRSRA